MKYSSTNFRRRIVAIACALVVFVPALQVAGVTSAYADDQCQAGVVCSRTINLSNFRVYVAKSWCGNSNGAPCQGSAKMWLNSGQSTPLLEDWDAFRVDAGWCYSYAITPGGVPVFQYGERWIKVSDGFLATVLAQAKVPSWLC